MGKPSVEDWLAINDLFIRYTTGLDDGDVEAVVACFTEDGALESPVVGKFEGRAGIREFAARNARLRAEDGVQFRHVVSNLMVDVEGDRARATCYLLDFMTRNGKTELLSPGKYDCQLVRQHGEWRFAYRLVLMDQPFAPVRGF